MSTHVHSHHVPAYVEEVRKHFKDAYAEAPLQTNRSRLAKMVL